MPWYSSWQMSWQCAMEELRPEKARRWLGEQLGRDLPVSTFYRWRRELAKYGGFNMDLKDGYHTAEQLTILEAYAHGLQQERNVDRAIEYVNQELNQHE